MALSQKLELRQSHALVMTPQLMQAIKLLQLSNLDLGAYVEAELERNPLLERGGEGEREEAASPDWEAAPGEDRPAAAGSDSPAGAANERPDGFDGGGEEGSGAEDGESAPAR